MEGPGDFDRIARYLSGGHVDGALAFSLHTDDPLPAITRRAGDSDGVRGPAQLDRRPR
ncbi:hypothetical protein SMICM17S_09293 [Streptomyces microflavus]